MDKQREMMLNKQKGGLGGSMTMNSKPGTGYTYGQSKDIDFNKLKMLVNESPSHQMYEPGSLNSTSTGLTPISKMNNILRFNQEENQKIIKMDDSDDSDDESIISKPTVPIKTEETSKSQVEPPKPKTEPVQNSRSQADALLKNLYGDSSDESEDDDKQAHEKMLAQKKD